MRRELYADTIPAPPAGDPPDRANHERTNLVQYQHAIDAAHDSIYIENQYLEDESIVNALREALTRDVEVLVVLPADPDYRDVPPEVLSARLAFHELRSDLDHHPRFMACGLASAGIDGARTSVYVHSKVIIVDGTFATIGSCNLHHHSLFGNGELNIAMFNAAAAHHVLVSLLSEHAGADLSGLDALAAIQHTKTVARQNLEKSAAGRSGWQGLAFPLSLAEYGQNNPLTGGQPEQPQF